MTQESDFYGSMDGASKFVRGDAIAGLLIMAINVIGGLTIGVLQHGLSVAEAGETYTLLTIGDGLVAQIPALIISTAAGVIVTRVSNDEDIGEQMVSQLFNNPRVMVLSAGVIGLLGLIPGMPNFVFLMFTAILLGLAWWMRGRQMKQPAAARRGVADDKDSASAQAANDHASAEASWEDVEMEDVLGLEVGYRLIPLVDSTQDGQLLVRVRGIRKKFAQEMGFLPPPIHIRDNLDLAPGHYRILLKGVEIGSGDIESDRWMAINPAMPKGRCPVRRASIRRSACPPAGSMRCCVNRRRSRLYGGRSQLGDRHPPEPSHHAAYRRAVQPPGDAAAARSHHQRDAEAGGRSDPGRYLRNAVPQSVAEPAGRARVDPRYAHHY